MTTTDWQQALVVRDKYGRLWTCDGRVDRPAVDGLDAEGIKAFEESFGPLTPVFDADGLPVVRTVGDLALKHLRVARIRVGGVEGSTGNLLDFKVFEERGGGQPTASLLFGGPAHQWRLVVPLDTPCEVVGENRTT